MDEQAIFVAALEQDTDRRAAFLDEVCGADPDLRQRMDNLLKLHDRAGGFFEKPAAEILATAQMPTAAESPGTVIGPYKLLQQIGEGGMGVVWMAEQTQPVQRKVALKVIKAGMDSRQVIARFEAERQVLAMMDHVNIARVFDGGATENGRPYFVMELVHGVPITKYCDDNHLTPRERLELFVPVCQAIQHAHQKGIIHRDIKPSNVMVTLYDGKPVPKVIDFGVAKATEKKLTERTLFTQYGTMVGTLEYMSPEQAEMSALGVDTRSDIYSLGVLLYELLTGSTPLTHKRMKEAAYAEILRMIKEEEPPRPSARLSDSGEALASISANRHTEPAKLTKLLRGELDWIVMKTLEKDRNRRYETANGFAADVQRYLADEAVQACPPSAGYRLRKFVRRNRATVLAAGVMVVLLIGGVVGTTMGWFRASSAEAQAVAAQRLASGNEAKARAAVNRYFTLVSEETLLDMPGFQPLREKLLEEARTYYEELLQQRSSDPNLQAELSAAYLRMGEIYEATGKSQQFIAAFQTGIELAERIVDENPGATDLHRRLAGFWKGHRRLHQSAGEIIAKANATETLQRVARLWQKLVDENPSVPEFQSDLAAVFGHLGELHYTETLEMLSWQEKAIALRKKLVSAYPSRAAYRSDLASSHIFIGVWSGRDGKRQAAIAHLREAGNLFDDLAKEFPKVPMYREGKGIANQSLISNLDGGPGSTEVEKISRENLKLYGDLAAEFPTVPSYQHGRAQLSLRLGDALATTGQQQEAESAYRVAAQVFDKLLEEFPTTGDYIWGVRESNIRLITSLTSTGRGQEAKAIAQKAAAICDKLATAFPEPSGHRYGLALFSLQVGELAGAGQPQEAERAYRLAGEVYCKLLEQHPTKGEYVSGVLEANTGLVNLLTSTGREQEAKAIALQADTLWDRLATAHPDVVQWRIYQAQSLASAGDWDKALDAYSKAIELKPDAAEGWHLRALAFAQSNQPDKALADLRQAIAKGFNAEQLKNDWRFAPLRSHADFKKLLEELEQKEKQKRDEVIATFRKAVDLDPKSAKAHTDLGAALRAQGKLDEAIDAIRTAIQLDPQYVTAHANLGYALEAQGKLDEAIACYRRAIELNPKYAWAHNALGRTGWALANNPDPKLRDLQRAVELGKEAVELAPQSVHAWQYLGWIHYRAGNWKDSIEALEKSCVLQNGGDCGQWIVMALAHGKLACASDLPEPERTRHKAEDRRWYDKAVRQIDANSRLTDSVGQDIRAFRVEASELLGVKEKQK